MAHILRPLPTWPEAFVLRGAANKEIWEVKVEMSLKMQRLWDVVAKGLQGADDEVVATSATAGASSAPVPSSSTSSTAAGESVADTTEATTKKTKPTKTTSKEGAAQVQGAAGDGRLPMTQDNVIADELALALIGSTLDATLLTFYKKSKSAKGMWDALQRRFSQSVVVFKVHLRKEMSSLKMQRDTVTEYINRATSMRERHAAAGVHIDDVDFVHTVLSGLPDEYDTMVDVLTSELICPDIDRVQHVLSSAEIRIVERDVVVGLQVKSARANAAIGRAK